MTCNITFDSSEYTHNTYDIINQIELYFGSTSFEIIMYRTKENMGVENIFYIYTYENFHF